MKRVHSYNTPDQVSSAENTAASGLIHTLKKDRTGVRKMKSTPLNATTMKRNRRSKTISFQDDAMKASTVWH